MNHTKKLTDVNVKVPFHGPGNVIHYKEVDFNVYKVDGHYSAIPACSQQDRVLASLPEELTFDFKDGIPESTRGFKDGNLHVIKEIAHHLKAHKIVD